MECAGRLKTLRFGVNTDGIHMHVASGRRDFTKSVINIFKRAQMLKSKHEEYKLEETQ